MCRYNVSYTQGGSGNRRRAMVTKEMKAEVARLANKGVHPKNLRGV
jgi:hypothetical protein